MIATLSREIEVPLVRVGQKAGNLTTTVTIPDLLEIMDDPKEKPPQGYGCFRVMTPKDGDRRIKWNRNNYQEIVNAKTLFDDLVAQGLIPYRVNINGWATNEVMVEFDPYAEEIIFLPVSLVAAG